MNELTDASEPQNPSRRDFLLLLAGATVATATAITGCGGGGGNSSDGDLVPGPEFFPLETDDNWQWETIQSIRPNVLPTGRVVGPVAFHGNTVIAVDGPFFDDSSSFGDGVGVSSPPPFGSLIIRAYYQVDASELYLLGYNYAPGAGGDDWVYNPTGVLPWSLKVGESTTLTRSRQNSGSNSQYTTKITRLSDQVITNSAGTFKCIVYTIIQDPTSPFPTDRTLYLAKDIGIVRITSDEYAFTSNLTFARVNGKTTGTFKPG